MIHLYHMVVHVTSQPTLFITTFHHSYLLLVLIFVTSIDSSSLPHPFHSSSTPHFYTAPPLLLPPSPPPLLLPSSPTY